VSKLQPLRRKVIALKNSAIGVLSPEFSQIFLASDRAGWALDNETLELRKLLRKLGKRADLGSLHSSVRQCVHYSDQFELRWLLRRPNLQYRFSVDYFHGRPGTEPGFTELYGLLSRHHNRLARVRVTHSEIRNVILSTGIAPEKVHQIPVGVDLDLFPRQTPETKHAVREELGIPQSAAVIGSFQKDGVGWGESDVPKLVKGPDVFVEALRILKAQVPELWVLLTGPARGYVKKKLGEYGIPYVHRFAENYADIGRYFQALDAYIISSRQEGAPKALFESMAVGVPLIATRVGQCMDLIEQGKNGWMVDVEDSEGLAHFTAFALSHSEERRRCIEGGLKTAYENRYDSELPLWQRFLDGYVNQR
jgi:glycosyltransferase involved in cell wall biosynthesis